MEATVRDRADGPPAVPALDLRLCPSLVTSGAASLDLKIYQFVNLFDNGVPGQPIVLIGGDSDCTVVDGNHLVLAGDWVAAPGKTLSLVFDGGDWIETARSDN